MASLYPAQKPCGVTSEAIDFISLMRLNPEALFEIKISPALRQGWFVSYYFLISKKSLPDYLAKATNPGNSF